MASGIVLQKYLCVEYIFVSMPKPIETTSTDLHGPKQLHSSFYAHSRQQAG